MNRALPLPDLADRVAIVTGGTSGIGRAASEALAMAGARVYLTSRDGQAAAACAREIASTSGAAVVGLAADLSSEDGCIKLVGELLDREPKIDLLVNNAGATWGASFNTFPYSAWDRAFALNVAAPFMLVRGLTPALERAGSLEDPARVINMGSIHGMIVPDLPTFSYTSSKAALHHLTRVLAVELGPSHIAVNTIAPGPFESKMMRETLARHGDKYVRETPLGRLGQHRDIAGLVLFLASSSSAFITGATIPIDGGLSIPR